MTRGSVLRDAREEQRLHEILNKLLAVTPTTGHWTATIVNEPAFNAMTASDNYIFVYRGLLDALPDDEVAAVLAHEIGHRLAAHEVTTSGEQWGEALSILATMAAGATVASQKGSKQRDIEDVMNATHQLGSGLTTLRYSEDKEREADQIEIFLLADAGVNPAATVSLWEKQATGDNSMSSDFFSTHPLNEDRYAMTARLLPFAQERYQLALKGRKVKRKKSPPPLTPSAISELSQAEKALSNNDLQTATARAQSLAAQAPSSPKIFNLLGCAKALAGEEKHAVIAFKKGLTLASEHPTLIYNMGCIQARQGKTDEALDSLEKAFKPRPT